MNCDHCGAAVASSDVVLGTHLVSMPTPYHEACVDVAKREQGLLRRPFMRIAPRRLSFFIGMNVVNVLLGVALVAFSGALAPLYPPLLTAALGVYVAVLGLLMLRSLLKYRRLTVTGG